MWTGTATADVSGALRTKRAETHRGLRQRYIEPLKEAGYTSAIVTLNLEPANRCNQAGSIYDELVHNHFADATRARYVSIIDELGRRGADRAILACTEIPLLLSPEESPLPAFSTTELHCQAAVRVAMDLNEDH